MKHILLFLSCILIVSISSAQIPTNQDCLGAIPVCQKIFIQPNAYSGTGNYPAEINPALSCLNQGEKNDVWYVFTVQNAGNLSFTIYTNSPGDDYDWTLINLTNATCADIYSNPSIEVSCNYSGIPGNTGMNGLPGLQNNPVLPVGVGETYVLNISNFSSNQSGYTLDFSASTATIYDTIPPVMLSFNAIQCNDDSLVVNFSENVLCQSVQLSDFKFINPLGNQINLSSISSAGCQSGADYYKSFVIKFSPPLTLSGNYTLHLVDTVIDACSNVAIYPDSSTVNVSGTNFLLNSTNVDCQGGTLGSASADSVNGSPPPYTYLWSNGQTTATITGLTAGSYTVTVTPSFGCPSVKSVTITGGSFVSSISGDSVICNNDSTTLICSISGANYAWTYNGNATGSNSQMLVTNDAGIYVVSVTNSAGCSSTSSFTVSLESLLPAPVVRCIPDPNNAGGFIYTWNSVSGATGYLITVNGVSNQITDTVHSEPSAVNSIFVQAINGLCGPGEKGDAYCEIIIPNVVTPNGDGFNDTFSIKNLEQFDNVSLQLFNRWGNNIYETGNYVNDYSFGDQPDGVYFYVLKVPGKDPFTGNVTVIRLK